MVSVRVCRSLVVFLAVGMGLASATAHGESAVERLALKSDALRCDVAKDPDGLAGFSCGEVHWLGRTGEPQLPWLTYHLLLAADADLASVSVSLKGATYTEIKGTWAIGPVPPPKTWDDHGQAVVVWPTDRKLVNGRDMAVYGRDAEWPGESVRLLNTGQLRRHRLAYVGVPLVRYNPKTSVLRKLTAGTITVSYERRTVKGQRVSTRRDVIGDRSVRGLAANYADASSKYLPSAVSVSGHSKPTAVARTTFGGDPNDSWLDVFADHKRDLGWYTKIVTDSAEYDETGQLTDPNADGFGGGSARCHWELSGRSWVCFTRSGTR